jgi:hypothetical protein
MKLLRPRWAAAEVAELARKLRVGGCRFAGVDLGLGFRSAPEKKGVRGDLNRRVGEVRGRVGWQWTVGGVWSEEDGVARHCESGADRGWRRQAA